jgi:GntR family transcriptional regulator/MocR family aminotransferase
MRAFNFTLPKDRSKEEKPLYLQIAAAVREAIKSRQIQPGEALPSTRSLAYSFKAHRHTVMAALDELVAEGWIASTQRQGYRVCETIPTEFFETQIKEKSKKAPASHTWRFARETHLPQIISGDSAKFNFKSGVPDLRLFPFQEFRSCLNEAIRRQGPKLMDYGDVEGHPGLIAELRTYLRRIRAISGREIIITHGSQEAIFLIGQLLLGPKDHVAVEELGYPPAMEALRASGATLVPIKIDSEGIDPDHLESVLRKRSINLIYLTPLHQYPTTVSLPVPRRIRIYELAQQYRVPILEDDYDHEYHYRCQPFAPLVSDDPAGLILYVSTFSKVFSPSARLGFMAVPPELVSRLSGLKRVVSRQNDHLIQDALARWIKSGGFERHLRRTRRLYEERCDTLIECLEDARVEGAKISWSIPDGGMAAWVRTQKDSDQIAKRAQGAGVLVGHEAEFRGKARDEAGGGLRIAFARHSPEEIRKGFAVLSEFL